MQRSPSHPIRIHGRPPLIVVAVVLVALLSLTRPPGAVGAPVDPVPVGVWPLAPTPRVVQAFDPPDSTWGAGHRGVDLAGNVRQVVRTALAGRVTFAARLAGRGVVVVDHGPTRTTYEPVTAAAQVGDVLARGQPIGTLELAGSHCFPRACLHWGWKLGQTYLDPLLLVGGGPIVLLPLWRGTPQPGSGVVTPPFADVAARLLARSRRARLSSISPPSGRPSSSAAWHRPLARRPLLL
jgi:murein DD-endopeptidase MepM/ murein hydrolase activator NlpD